jgi:hypothetical protein
MFVDEEGRIAAVMSLEIAAGVVQTIRGITNPDKLAHLGTVADLRAILRRRRTTEWGQASIAGELVEGWRISSRSWAAEKSFRMPPRAPRRSLCAMSVIMNRA